MKKLAIIPSRYQSSRFPGKPLIDLAGKTMIQRVYEGVQNSQLFHEVIVATDDDRIFDHVESFGGKVLMTNSLHRSGTERCGEIIENYSEGDVIVNIQGDEPLVNAEQLSVLLAAFDDNRVEIATIASPKINTEEIQNPNRIKVVVDHNHDAIYFSRSPIPFQQNDVSYPFLRHIGLYGYRREVLQKLVRLQPTQLEQIESLEQLRWMYHGYKIRVQETSIETPNIDTPEDVDKVLKIIQS